MSKRIYTTAYNPNFNFGPQIRAFIECYKNNDVTQPVDLMGFNLSEISAQFTGDEFIKICIQSNDERLNEVAHKIDGIEFEKFHRELFFKNEEQFFAFIVKSADLNKAKPKDLADFIYSIKSTFQHFIDNKERFAGILQARAFAELEVATLRDSFDKSMA